MALTTFDTPSELRKLARWHLGARALLRIRADDPAARCQLGNKYGAAPEDVPALMKVRSKRHPSHALIQEPGGNSGTELQASPCTPSDVAELLPMLRP